MARPYSMDVVLTVLCSSGSGALTRVVLFSLFRQIYAQLEIHGLIQSPRYPCSSETEFLHYAPKSEDRY